MGVIIHLIRMNTFAVVSVSVAFLVASVWLLGPADAIKCYDCSGEDCQAASNLKNCSSNIKHCLKTVSINKAETGSCAPASICLPINAGGTGTFCCDSDGCNAANSLKMAPLMAMGFAAVHIMLRLLHQ